MTQDRIPAYCLANPALWKLAQALLDAGSEYSGQGQDWKCPAHEDNRASLGIRAGDKKPVLIFCQAGCEPEDVLKAVDLTWASLNTVQEVFQYDDADGVGVRKVYRTDRYNAGEWKKDIKQGPANLNHPGSVSDVPDVLYELPALLSTIREGGRVYVVEGEKSVEALRASLPNPGGWGTTWCATTAHGGAGRPWQSVWTDLLAQAADYSDSPPSIDVIADNDKAGYGRALRVASALVKAEIFKGRVRVFASATDREHDDVVDHLAAGYTMSDLKQIKSSALRVLADKADPPENPQSVESEARNLSSAATLDDEWPNPGVAPKKVAEKWLSMQNGVKTWRGFSYLYNQNANVWKEFYDKQLHGLLSNVLDGITISTYDKDGKRSERPYNPRRTHLAEVEHFVTLGSQIPPDDLTDILLQDGSISFPNGLPKFEPISTPPKFSTTTIPLKWSDVLKATPADIAPWLEFLENTWTDQESIDLLQEWFGYVVSGRTDLQVFFALYGVAGSGKSTIARILETLIGPRNVTGGTPTMMANDHGLEDWVGKSLALLNDINLLNMKQDVVSRFVETIKAISGQDAIAINPKNKKIMNERLGARIMWTSNYPPVLPDASSALSRRLLALSVTRTPEETDSGLYDRLAAPESLAAIFAWSLRGLERLNRSGKFTTPERMADAVAEFRSSGSPVHEFSEECLEITHDDQDVVKSTDLFNLYRNWCDGRGLFHLSDRKFYSDLWSAYGLDKKQIKSLGTKGFSGVKLKRPGIGNA